MRRYYSITRVAGLKNCVKPKSWFEWIAAKHPLFTTRYDNSRIRLKGKRYGEKYTAHQTACYIHDICSEQHLVATESPPRLIDPRAYYPARGVRMKEANPVVQLRMIAESGSEEAQLMYELRSLARMALFYRVGFSRVLQLSQLAINFGIKTGWWKAVAIPKQYQWEAQRYTVTFSVTMTDSDVRIMTLLRFPFARMFHLPKDVVNILFHRLGYPRIK